MVIITRLNSLEFSIDPLIESEEFSGRSNKQVFNLELSKKNWKEIADFYYKHAKK